MHNKSVDFSGSEWSKYVPNNLLPIRKKNMNEEYPRKIITPRPVKNRDSQIFRQDKKEQDPYFIKLRSIITPAKSPNLKSKKERLMKKVKKTWTPAPKRLFQYKDKSSVSISPEHSGNSHQIIFSPNAKMLSSIGRGVLIKL